MRVSYVADSHYAYYAARIDLQESVIELCKAAHAAFHDSTSSLKCQNIQKQQQARTSCCCCCCASLMHAWSLLLPSSMAQARMLGIENLHSYCVVMDGPVRTISSARCAGSKPSTGAVQQRHQRTHAHRTRHHEHLQRYASLSRESQSPMMARSHSAVR